VRLSCEEAEADDDVCCSHEMDNAPSSSVPIFSGIYVSNAVKYRCRMRGAQVEPYLGKVFNGAAKMHFEEADTVKGKLVGIESRDGELLRFVTPVMVKGKSGMPLEIDQWMFGIEKSMKEAVLENVQACIQSYGDGNFKDWLMVSCGQAVAVVSSMVWANEVSRILEALQVLKIPVCYSLS